MPCINSPFFARHSPGFFLAWPRIVAMPAPLLSPDSLHWHCESSEAARPIQEAIMQRPETILPITKQQSRTINDTKATDRYRHRLLIDSLLADRKHQKELQEVWDERSTG